MKPKKKKKKKKERKKKGHAGKKRKEGKRRKESGLVNFQSATCLNLIGPSDLNEFKWGVRWQVT